MIVVLALLALVVTTQFENILDMALYAYTMVGAAVTPALLAAFLWKTGDAARREWSRSRHGHRRHHRLRRHGANSGFESFCRSASSSIPLDYDYIIYPAGFLSIASLIVVSLLTPPVSEEKWRPFAAD